MRQIVLNRWFALADLLLVLICGLAWVAVPGYGIGLTVIASLPWVMRLSAGRFPFQRTAFDWLIVLFVITAGVGFWAAYDKEAAAHKFWLLLMAILLYYALSGQPQENLLWVARLFFSMGVGISIYFFLTHDFVALPRKLPLVNAIGLWIMQVRPSIAWKPIHPNYVAGIAAIMTPFAFYPKWELGNKLEGWRIASAVTKILSLTIVASALVMTTSRGVFLAILSAIGTWVVWKVLERSQSTFGLKQQKIFPILVLIYLILVIAVLYAGPASFTGSVTAQGKYGNGTRAELLLRSSYFLHDFPFTGAGLASFPGLYSYYMLEVPTFYLINSHNLFLDVALEQGVAGGLCYLFLVSGSLWFVSHSIVRAHSAELRTLSWLTLFALVISMIHGMVDDYLYNGNGTILALALVGVAMIMKPEIPQDEGISVPFDYRLSSLAVIIVVGICILSLNRIRSAWYADLGAVQMTRVELADFPTNQWAGQKFLPQLQDAEASLRSSLRLNPNNRTANARLGLISLARRDFGSAAAYLEIANTQGPENRGIIKSLGYCYAWLGKLDRAKFLLDQIPEAQAELGEYAWWWKTQDRPDLAEKATKMLSYLASKAPSP